MKVLITGGYGFIGSHAADRFFKEGHDVYIIDNLSTGNKHHLTFKHKNYLLSVEDAKCEEIFRANKFDTVVHLAAQVSVSDSIANPAKDSESNVLGMVNMLSLSGKYGVSRFIYASSAAVYGMKSDMPIREDESCSPISPYGISKLTGELYSSRWKELYGLQTIGFRFSNVYGPRQADNGEGGVVSVFVNRALAGQPLRVHGDGEQTRDFIYVEDVADAIYRASCSQLDGIYNLSTGKETSVNELIEALKELAPLPKLEYSDKRPGDIERSALDNSRVMRDLDWAPMYAIREGVHRTYRYFEQRKAEEEAAASSAAAEPSAWAKSWRGALKPLMPYIENGLAFALAAWLALGQQNLVYSGIDVKLFYIVIMGIMYGNRQSILAVAMSIGLYIYQKTLDGREMISLMYDTDFFFQIAVYLFTGLVVGYAIERKNAQIQSLDQKLKELEGRHEFLNGVYREVRGVKEELQLRIQNSGDSYGKIYSITRELESLEPEQVFHAAVNVVRTIMNAPNVSIYTVNRQRAYMRLVAYSGKDASEAAKSLKIADHRHTSTILETGKVFVNKELAEDVPLMCAPVYYQDRIAAMIAVDGLSFEKFSLYHQNLFKITTDLISSALSKALAYIDATEKRRYVEGTSLLRTEAFQTILNAKKLAWDQHRTPYLLLSGDVPERNWTEISGLVEGMLRETDYVGLSDDQRLIVLLSNTNTEDASLVIERFAGKGIALSAAAEGL